MRARVINTLQSNSDALIVPAKYILCSCVALSVVGPFMPRPFTFVTMLLVLAVFSGFMTPRTVPVGNSGIATGSLCYHPYCYWRREAPLEYCGAWRVANFIYHAVKIPTKGGLCANHLEHHTRLNSAMQTALVVKESHGVA